jgi:BTB/POZ domain
MDVESADYSSDQLLLQGSVSGPPSSERVTFQVGERRFDTTVGTLTTRSEYFAQLFSGRWPVNKQSDGSIFIDANGDIFEHILRYLRRGIFPLAYDKDKGHDYKLYAEILVEAKYFQCSALVVWLESQCYHQCITWYISTEIQEAKEPYSQGSGIFVDGQFEPSSWAERKVYLCPRRIPVHRGNRSKCGRQCESVRGEDDIEFECEKSVSAWLVTKKRFEFHSGWMIDTGYVFAVVNCLPGS